MVECTKLSEFVAHSTEVHCMCFAPQSAQLFATGGEDCRVNVWKVGSPANLLSLSGNKSGIRCLCFDPEEHNIVSGAVSGSIKVFDLNEGKVARTLRGHKVHVTAVHYHPYGEFMTSGGNLACVYGSSTQTCGASGRDATVRLWDARQKECVTIIQSHDHPVNCVQFSPDGRLIASASTDGRFLLWDVTSGWMLLPQRILLYQRSARRPRKAGPVGQPSSSPERRIQPRTLCSCC
jgi:katanin p80 WD40 repeat-containing subunit B1